MRNLTRALWLFVFVVFPAAFLSTAQAEPTLVPRMERVKINSVDVSQAPEMRIRATLLDPLGIATPPDNVVIDVFEGKPESAREIASGIHPIGFGRSEAPVDLAVVASFSTRLSEDERESIAASLGWLVEQVTERNAERAEGGDSPDRLAGLFDNGKEIHTGVTGKDAKDPILTVLQTPEQFQAHIEAVKGSETLGRLSFLYSGIQRAIDTLSSVDERNRPGYENARRAILVITDGYDSFTYRKEDVEGTIGELAKAAREAGITIYVVLYNSKLKSLAPLFEGLSRKTGGTYRAVTKPKAKPDNVCNLKVYSSGTVCNEVQHAWSEIVNEYVIDFTHSGLHEGQEVQYRIKARCMKGTDCWNAWESDSHEVDSSSYAVMRVEKLQFNWALFRLVCFIVGGVLIVTLIALLIRRKVRQKRELEEAAREEQELQEKIEKGEVCPKCHRTMMPDWKECMFCAREAQEAIAQAKAEEAKKKAEEAKKDGDAAGPKKPEGRVCKNCGRTMMPQWKECLFCKAGIGAEGGGPKKGLAPMAEKKKAEGAAPEGARICPVCKRPMKAHWTVCLYCEADAANRPAPSAPPKEEAPVAAPAPVPEVRVCPTCGRPMKAHWDVCLYCEANKAR